MQPEDYFGMCPANIPFLEIEWGDFLRKVESALDFKYVLTDFIGNI